MGSASPSKMQRTSFSSLRADGAYALEKRHRVFVALFAIACALSSAYGFLIGSIPFGSVEALWSLIALHRFHAGDFRRSEAPPAD